MENKVEIRLVYFFLLLLIKEKKITKKKFVTYRGSSDEPIGSILTEERRLKKGAIRTIIIKTKINIFLIL